VHMRMNKHTVPQHARNRERLSRQRPETSISGKTLIAILGDVVVHSLVRLIVGEKARHAK
jgi:hypothetical protein